MPRHFCRMWNGSWTKVSATKFLMPLATASKKYAPLFRNEMIKNIECSMFNIQCSKTINNKHNSSSLIKKSNNMKSLITLTIGCTLWLLCGFYANAQEMDHDTKTSVEQLRNLKEKIIQEEKDALKATVENINARLENSDINEAEAEALKQQAAEKHALNIENRIAIIDNQVELLKRNKKTEEEEGNNYFFRVGSSDVNYSVVYLGPKKKIKQYDKRTISSLVFAFGLNNVITEGESLEDSDFKIAGSRFAELGWAWKTRVFKNTNFLRIKYGVSFQFNSLKPTDNHFYVDTGEQTELQVHPLDLDKSKFRMDNLVVPIHFEFGPSKKNEYDD